MIHTEFKTEQFKEKAFQVHGDKFLYDKAIYTGAQSKLIVTCKLHGDFLTTPDTHIRVRTGCAKCHFQKLGEHNSCKPEEFIPKAVAVHGSKYDYSKVVYNRSKEKLTVVCKSHGDFKITPNEHLRGQGCRKCAAFGYQVNKPGYLYVLTSESITKIGITNRAVSTRVREITRRSGKTFTEVFSFLFKDGSVPLAIETELLSVLRSQYKSPSQIYDGSTESFVDVDLPKLLQTISAIMTEKTLLTTKENYV